MSSNHNLSQNANHYWDNGAYCLNCGLLQGNVINNNIHPIWHPACKPGCNSTWHDQDPLEYEETDRDRFFRELEEEQQQSDREQHTSTLEWEETDEEKFLRELEEEEQADWEQSQLEWEQERLQEEALAIQDWEQQQADMWLLQQQIDIGFTQHTRNHIQCCLQIIARAPTAQ